MEKESKTVEKKAENKPKVDLAGLRADVEKAVINICRAAHGVTSGDPIYDKIATLTFCVDKLRTAKDEKSVLSP